MKNKNTTKGPEYDSWQLLEIQSEIRRNLITAQTLLNHNSFDQAAATLEVAASKLRTIQDQYDKSFHARVAACEVKPL